MQNVPAFFKWSSIITDDIIKTFPIDPITDNDASISSRFNLLSPIDDSVIGENSLIWCLVPPLILLMLWTVRGIDVTAKNGVANVAAAAGIDVGAISDIVAFAVPRLLLFDSKNVATVANDIFNAMMERAQCEWSWQNENWWVTLQQTNKLMHFV